MNDLTRPGNYTFKLTVTDTDKITNSSTANITVLKVTDYPPEANAGGFCNYLLNLSRFYGVIYISGQDVIIFLPKNQITLNGNLSTDDHAIITWEWTKSAKDADKAVDMQDTRTPFLRLSDLEEGMYTFILKVTDSSNQSSTAEVHVFVKPPTNQPPTAKAGDNITISLPQTWVVLNGNMSKDDNKIIGFKWLQVKGPSSTTFAPADSSATNVTGLTKGQYIFQLSVTDNNNNTANDTVYVTVNQSKKFNYVWPNCCLTLVFLFLDKNQKPIANAGGNLEVELPLNAIYVNGSKSSDDWEIIKWKWLRADNSLALGNIAEGSDETAVLILTNVVAGKYVFNLSVYDEQGMMDIDTVTVTVKTNPKLYYLVEITIDCDINLLTEGQYNIIKGKLALLVKNNMKLQVYLVSDFFMIFYIENLL